MAFAGTYGGYLFYYATVIAKSEGCGPFEVITNNTINSTPQIQEMAEKKFPGLGFIDGEVMWIQSPKDPDPNLVKTWLQDCHNAGFGFDKDGKYYLLDPQEESERQAYLAACEGSPK
jgi:hypothetical protein